MNCPRCGKKPFSFARVLRTLNPMRVTCEHCSAHLVAGPLAYLWTALHVPFALGVVWAHRELSLRGAFQAAWTLPAFLLAVLAVLFATAYVIPWVAFRGLYREAT